MSTRITEDYPGVITLRDAKLEDAGIYECRASNIAGETTLSTTLEIQQQPSIKLYPDIQSFDLTEGDELKFNCIATGVPTPSVTIKTPDGAPRLEVRTSEIHRDQGEASISHYNVQRNQAGLYECVATNDAGQDVRYIQVNVAVKRGDAGMISLLSFFWIWRFFTISKLTFSFHFPTFYIKSQEMDIWDQKLVLLNCPSLACHSFQN